MCRLCVLYNCLSVVLGRCCFGRRLLATGFGDGVIVAGFVIDIGVGVITVSLDDAIEAIHAL